MAHRKKRRIDDKGVKWTHLKQLYRLEWKIQVKLSDLNDISIARNPIERQRVCRCFREFSRNWNKYGRMIMSSLENKVLTWWKFSNFKTLQIDKLHNDPLQAEIRSDLILSLSLVKWRLIWLAVKVII